MNGGLHFTLDECEGVSKTATLTEEQIHISISMINEDHDRRGDLTDPFLRWATRKWG